MADRNLEHLVRPATAGTGLDVFAAEHSSAQVVWSTLPPGEHRLTVRADGAATAPRGIRIDGEGGCGSLVVDGLMPGTVHRIELDGASREFATPAAPRGQELFRFATISDLHLGRGARPYAGPLGHIGAHDPVAEDGAEGVSERSSFGGSVGSSADGGSDDGAGRRGGTRLAARLGRRSAGTGAVTVDRPLQCATAAIDEAIEWGAQLLVVKGDVCEESFDWIWDQAAELLGGLPIPVLILPGNHDTGRLREFEPGTGAAHRGLALTRGVGHVDVPGLRLVLVDSTRPGNSWGAVARHAEQTADLAAEADTGVFIATHHHPQRFALPVFWPMGIPGRDASDFARTVAAANPRVLASSGHTHRCRRRTVGDMAWSEVAATNHFPGVWAGYTVHEGGLSQTVRRITEPDALGWTEHTRRILGGVWALWSTGTVEDRCFTLDW